MKMKCFEMPNASYTNRCGAFKKKSRKPEDSEKWNAENVCGGIEKRILNQN